MSMLVLWKRLTPNDFNAMNGLASPRGHGGGARHIALGVRTRAFPIDHFLNTRRHNVTLATAAQPGAHEAGTLAFVSNPSRRGGEWMIRDQFSHRHPAWTSLAGFPASYDEADPPFVLVFRSGNTFHVRFARETTLAAFPPTAIPNDLLVRPKGIQRVPEAFRVAFNIPQQSLLDAFEEAVEQHASDAFDPRSVADGRQRVMASILRRQGQHDFRRKLLSAYKTQCAVTHCRTLWVLEAAHITPYRGVRTNVVSNGLLLRSDIHILFDLALLSIEPSTLTICVSSRVADSPYLALAGTTPVLPERDSLRPSRTALEEHYRFFQP
jgi:hypothetical protein